MTDPLKYLGSISGTSVDGLDLALIEISQGAIVISQAHTVSFPRALSTELRALANTGANELDRLGYADAALGEFIGHACLSFLRAHDIAISSITAIGSHGQTVRHRPGGVNEPRFTMQIGDPNRIAEVTGLRTVADFRRRDVAAGGQGAPLVPPFHKALFTREGPQGHRAILNIGGISNVSILSDPPIGFDTGPGNCLMDEWCALHGHGDYDEAGAWAATGRVSEPLLKRCLSDGYFRMAAPKSTGREYFHLTWLKAQLDAETPRDVQATLCELTARCTADALSTVAPEIEEIVVCGGGRLNTHLLQRLRETSRRHVISCDDLGVNGDAIEAAAFAWLAHRTLGHSAGNEPAVTGADGYRILGGIYPA